MKDRSETKDLSAEAPERVAELADKWMDHAQQVARDAWGFGITASKA